MKILLVDDNADDLELMRYELRGIARECVCARSKLELAGAIAAGPYDTAILDYWLPGLPWPEAMHMIRASYPQCPVIVVSGALLNEKGAYDTLRDGADDFLVKDRLHSLAHIVRREVIRRLAKAERDTAIATLVSGSGARDLKIVSNK